MQRERSTKDKYHALVMNVIHYNNLGRRPKKQHYGELVTITTMRSDKGSWTNTKRMKRSCPGVNILSPTTDDQAIWDSRETGAPPSCFAPLFWTATPCKQKVFSQMVVVILNQAIVTVWMPNVWTNPPRVIPAFFAKPALAELVCAQDKVCDCPYDSVF